MALTFDDLPFVSAGGDKEDALENAQRATEALLGVLAAHQAPAVGFVNEGQLDGPDREARIALLQKWVDAGAVLGNQTKTRVDLNTVTSEAFQEEIARGEPVTRRLMQPRVPYTLYFRHPYAHTGETPVKKTATEQYLAAHNYRIAPHTIDSDDDAFNAAFVEAWRVDDIVLKYRTLTAYLDFVPRATEFAERAARQIFGRDIPQVILLHANDINVETLDDLLNRLERRGYRFVTLDEVMTDPAYATKDTVVTDKGPTWLWRWATSLGLTVNFSDDPEPPQWVVDLPKQR